MNNTSNNLLGTSEEPFFNKLLLERPEEQSLAAELPSVRAVVPEPGFCIKTKTTDGKRKVFINVCKAENIPAPKEISDEELLKLVESEDPSGFRVPMSLGEPHEELDKSGQPCTAYDVIISPQLFDTILKRDIMRGFFLTISMEGLEAKYEMTLDRNWTVLKNRKFLGSLPEQNIRTRSKPWIMEMNDESVQSSKSISAVKSNDISKKKAAQPAYTMIQEPVEGYPQFIVAEIHLPLVKTAASLVLDT